MNINLTVVAHIQIVVQNKNSHNDISNIQQLKKDRFIR